MAGGSLLRMDPRRDGVEDIYLAAAVGYVGLRRS